MADVINLGDHRKSKTPKRPEPSIEEMAAWCVDEIMPQWEKFSHANRLIDFIKQSIPQYARDNVNYLQDLNSIADLESKIGIHVQVLSPGFNEAHPHGWVVAFRLNGKIIGTPWMASEAHARAFCVLLYLKLRRELTDAGIAVTS